MKKKVVCAFVLGLFVSCTMPIATFGETQENVIAVQTDQNEVENQDNFTGEKLIEGKWHYFLEGKMVTDEFVQLSENRIVYYDESGCMVYGEKNIYGSWYYFDPVYGSMARGLTKLPKKTVYYDEINGQMQYGEVKI